jgi:hypothetical protein
MGFFILKMGFNTPPLGAVKTGGAGDLFPRIRKDLKEKSSIPRCSAAGVFYFIPEHLQYEALPGKAQPAVIILPLGLLCREAQ